MWQISKGSKGTIETVACLNTREIDTRFVEQKPDSGEKESTEKIILTSCAFHTHGQ